LAEHRTESLPSTFILSLVKPSALALAKAWVLVILDSRPAVLAMPCAFITRVPSFAQAGDVRWIVPDIVTVSRLPCLTTRVSSESGRRVPDFMHVLIDAGEACGMAMAGAASAPITATVMAARDIAMSLRAI
jgi:hypothetical protein